MLVEARQAVEVDVAQLALLNQLNEQPEGHHFGGVVQERTHNEVHSLHVVYQFKFKSYQPVCRK